jgi:HEAT repeat protein
MPKPDPIEQLLDRLSQLRTEPKSVVLPELQKTLKHRSNLIAAKAAKIAGELRIAELVPDLVNAFERFMADPAKLDKRCAATTEIVAALYEMDTLDPALYLRGIVHVQREASYGPPVDVAAKLRAQCALGLVRTNHPEALTRVVDLLADPEPQARIGAIRALAACAGDNGALLLRFKVLIGDSNPDVLSECFTGLLESDFSGSLGLMRRLIESENESTAESAILALGTQRHSEAFAILREKFERTIGADLRKTLLTAMATMRIDEATGFLISLVGDASIPTAVETVKALARYHNEERVRTAAQSAAAARGDSRLSKAIADEFHQRLDR